MVTVPVHWYAIVGVTMLVCGLFAGAWVMKLKHSHATPSAPVAPTVRTSSTAGKGTPWWMWWIAGFLVVAIAAAVALDHFSGGDVRAYLRTITVTKNDLANAAFLLVGVGLSALLIWSLSGKSRNMFVAMVGGLLAIGYGVVLAVLIENDMNWRSLLGSTAAGAGPTRNPAAQAPAQAPATPPPAVLNAGDTYSIPCTLNQVFVITMKKGSSIANSGCVLATRVLQNDDPSPSLFHFFVGGAAPKLVSPTIAQCNPGEPCLAPDFIKTHSDTAVIKIAACPAARGVVPGTYQCR